VIRVNICGAEHECDDSVESWVNERYNNIKRAGNKLWFIIDIDTNDIHISLASVSAPKSGGTPFNHFNQLEKRIILMWRELNAKLDDNLNNLFRFLQKLRREI
jgi:hypothetical protein